MTFSQDRMRAEGDAIPLHQRIYRLEGAENGVRQTFGAREHDLCRQRAPDCVELPSRRFSRKYDTYYLCAAGSLTRESDPGCNG